MKNKFLCILPALCAVLLLCIGCAEESTSNAKTNRDLLIAHPWRLRKALTVGGADITIEIARNINRMTFRSDSTVEAISSNGEARVGRWELVNGNKTIMIENDAFLITALTEDKMDWLVPGKNDGDEDAPGEIMFMK